MDELRAAHGVQDEMERPGGVIQPTRVFDRAIGLDEVPDGYRAMASREALKVLIKP